MASLRDILGDELYGEVMDFADRTGMPFSTTLHRSIRLGLAILRAHRSGKAIFLQDGEKINELTIL